LFSRTILGLGRLVAASLILLLLLLLLLLWWVVDINMDVRIEEKPEDLERIRVASRTPYKAEIVVMRKLNLQGDQYRNAANERWRIIPFGW
jgi:hypothetical protein